MADKLKSFDRKETGWHGLWYHPENGGFSSETINLSQLKKFKGTVRLYIRKNKFFEKGSNRPNYCFCIKDADSETFKLLEVTEEKEYAKQDEDGYWWTSSGERLYDRADVQKAINCAAKDGARGYSGWGDNIVEDYL